MNEPAKANPFDLLLDSIRQVVRQELEAAAKSQSKAVLLFDTTQAAKILNVSQSWLSAAAREGRIPTVKLGHYVRFKPSDLEEFIEAQQGSDERKIQAVR
jgi:excisionase family DNA binding protein